MSVTVKLRCNQCNKKINVNNYDCKCGKVYCEYHRFPFEHSCTYDWKKQNSEDIKKKIGDEPIKNNKFNL